MEIHVDDMVTITFYGAVLWMQGLQPIIQPVENEYGILLYNGDIFDETWDRDISDTQQIMERLSNAVSKLPSYHIACIQYVRYRRNHILKY